MTKILYISVSPRGAASQSGKLAEAYLAARSRQAPDVTIDRLDLWRTDLPEFAQQIQSPMFSKERISCESLA